MYKKHYNSAPDMMNLQEIIDKILSNQNWKKFNHLKLNKLLL